MLDDSTRPHSAPASRHYATVTVAAIIPLYNGAPFIRKALESVLAQTEPPDEIIVVDDGSLDDGPSIVRAMASHHQIRILHKPNGGQSSARNMGIAATSCSHIALLDQDDLWYPHHIQVLKAPFLSDPEVGLVYGNLDRVDEAGRILYRNFLDRLNSPHPKRTLWDCLSCDMYILPSASIFSKADFDRVGGFDERLCGFEDDDLFLRMFAAGVQFIYIKNVSVTQWTLNLNSTSFSPRMSESQMIYFRKLLESYPESTSDPIVPRFFPSACGGLIRCLKTHDTVASLQHLADLREIAKHIPQERVRSFLQLAEVACQAKLHWLARALVQQAKRAAKKARRFPIAKKNRLEVSIK